MEDLSKLHGPGAQSGLNLMTIQIGQAPPWPPAQIPVWEGLFSRSLDWTVLDTKRSEALLGKISPGNF